MVHNDFCFQLVNKVQGFIVQYTRENYSKYFVNTFTDNSGKADGEDTLDEIRATLKAQQVSLDMAAPSLARDYYTEEEMVNILLFYCCVFVKLYEIFY